MNDLNIHRSSGEGPSWDFGGPLPGFLWVDPPKLRRRSGPWLPYGGDMPYGTSSSRVKDHGLTGFDPLPSGGESRHLRGSGWPEGPVLWCPSLWCRSLCFRSTAYDAFHEASNERYYLECQVHSTAIRRMYDPREA